MDSWRKISKIANAKVSVASAATAKKLIKKI